MNTSWDECKHAWLIQKKREIERLSYLHKAGEKIDGYPWQDEALILCVVYLDQFSNKLMPDKSNSSRKFCRLLEEYGSEIFRKIHLRQLLRQFLGKKTKKDVKQIGQKIIACLGAKGYEINPDTMLFEGESGSVELYQKLYNADELFSLLKGLNLTLKEGEEKQLREELWRGSVASICYDEIRSLTVHEGTTIPGIQITKDVTISFEVLYSVLKSVLQLEDLVERIFKL